MGRRLGLLAARWLAALAVGSSAFAANEDAAAKKYLDAAATRAGLCLHLGCGRANSPGLTAALAANGNMAVHGLALDDESAARARKAIAARGMAGRAIVEKSAARPLPYPPNVANLVVVEDPGALGASTADLLKIVAPGGVLCVGEGAAKTVKPRPSEMDDWTHPQHGADCNLVSSDKLITFPIGFRWIAGLPVNVTQWAACRGWVVAGGRCYTLSVNEPENLGRTPKTHFVGARDAYNGLPLWRIDCGTTDNGAYLNWRNSGPLVADEHRVYAVQKDKIIGVDGATGQIAVTFPTKTQANRLVLLDGVLVAACWEAREDSKTDFEGVSLWATWFPKSSVGSIEAFDAKTARPLWSAPFPSFMLMASSGVVYGLTHAGNPPTERTVVALDLKTGKEKWRAPHTQFGNDADLYLVVAGPGYIVVAKRAKEKAIFVLSADSGKALTTIKPAAQIWAPIVEGLLWYGGKKYDPLTGAVKGTLPMKSMPFQGTVGAGQGSCTPSTIVGPYVASSRGCSFIEICGEGDAAKIKQHAFKGARGGCIEGMVAANGMFYTAQNHCRCAPGQIYGFLAMGPSGEWPAAADFEKARPIERGPAANFTLEPEPKTNLDWPTFRHDAGRTGATEAGAPEKPRELWRQPVAPPGEGPVADAWHARLGSCLTAPVCAGGVVFVAGTDSGQVVALDAKSGGLLWSAMLGGRIDTPPTIHRGLCVVGCHDGWVYALRAKDGQLVWRTRVAPWERRLVAYGQVESVWPAVGTVLLHEGVLYANAGRTSESDGGVAVVALDPATGAQTWGKAIAPGPVRQNDLLRVSDGSLVWHHLTFDPKTGAAKTPLAVPKDASQGGMIDGTWTRIKGRRSGRAFCADKVTADIMAWNDKFIAAPAGLTPRDKGNTVPAGIKGIEAVALAENAVVYAGRVAQGAKATGTLFIGALPDGKKLAEFPLDAPPTYDGLAITEGRIFVSLQNGTVACYGQ